MKDFYKEASHILRDILNFKYHEYWDYIFDCFFLYLADSETADFKKAVADAVYRIVSGELYEEWELNEKELALLHFLYENYASCYEERVRQHIREMVQEERCGICYC